MTKHHVMLGCLTAALLSCAHSSVSAPAPHEFVITHEDSAAIYLAVGDSLINSFGTVPQYLSDEQVRSMFAEGHDPDKPGRLPRWLVDTLLTRPFFSGRCDLNDSDQCAIPRVGLVFRFSHLMRTVPGDSLAVDVLQNSVHPLQGPPDSTYYGFSALSRYILTRSPKGWRVVHSTLLLIS